MFFIKRDGWIEVICGCMFSGKSEELIRRMKRSRLAGQKVQAFKPVIDDRYHKTAVASHSGLTEEAQTVTCAFEVLDLVEAETDVVAIDEVQFLDENILLICQQLADRGKRVIVAGLDQDFRGESFGPTPELLAVSEYITKLHAICMKCGDPATRTQRLINGKPAKYDDPIILVGTLEQYEARCRHCHEVPS